MWHLLTLTVWYLLQINWAWAVVWFVVTNIVSFPFFFGSSSSLNSKTLLSHPSFALICQTYMCYIREKEKCAIKKKKKKNKEEKWCAWIKELSRASVGGREMKTTWTTCEMMSSPPRGVIYAYLHVWADSFFPHADIIHPCGSIYVYLCLHVYNTACSICILRLCSHAFLC